MKLSLFAAALVATLALAGSVAFAAADAPKLSNQHPNGDVKVAATSANSAAECTALQSQFDTAIKSHETAKKAAAAKALRQQGGRLCAAGKNADGIRKLDQALDDIGVKPMKAMN